MFASHRKISEKTTFSILARKVLRAAKALSLEEAGLGPCVGAAVCTPEYRYARPVSYGCYGQPATDRWTKKNLRKKDKSLNMIGGIHHIPSAFGPSFFSPLLHMSFSSQGLSLSRNSCFLYVRSSGRLHTGILAHQCIRPHC